MQQDLYAVEVGHDHMHTKSEQGSLHRNPISLASTG